MKHKLKSLEQAMWEDISEKCKKASEGVDFGIVYSVLKNLGIKGIKPHTGTTLTCPGVENSFQKWTKTVMEAPSGLSCELRKTPRQEGPSRKPKSIYSSEQDHDADKILPTYEKTHPTENPKSPTVTSRRAAQKSGLMLSNWYKKCLTAKRTREKNP